MLVKVLFASEHQEETFYKERFHKKDLYQLFLAAQVNISFVDIILSL